MSVAQDLLAIKHGLQVLADPVEALRDEVLGQVITPESSDYDAARTLVAFGELKSPAVIVKTRTAEDVATTVRFAQAQQLPVAVRSGGHSIAHLTVANDAVVVDLSLMKRVIVDPVAKTARVQGGATSGDIATVAQPLGLAVTTGDTRSVGVGGLVTGGGIGYLVRKQGLTIDNLLSAQVVLANGEIVTASAAENADLFWGIRGGGGNFGIVTEFVFQLHEVGTVLGGDLVFPASRELVRSYIDYALAAPDGLTTLATVMQAPPAPYIPVERQGDVILSVLVTWTGSLEEGEKVVAGLRALAQPIADTVAPIPYEDMYRYTDHFSDPHGASIRMMFADDLSDASIDAALEALETPSSPFGMFHFRVLGGAYGRVAPDATAFAHRRRNLFVSIINVWLDPTQERPAHDAWTASLWQKIQQDGEGVYVNFLELEGEDRVREAYPGKTWDRLVEIKSKYDPRNIFRFNQNITPKP